MSPILPDPVHTKRTLSTPRARLDAVYYIWFTPSMLLLYLFYATRRAQVPSSPPLHTLSFERKSFDAQGFDTVAAKD